MSESRFLGEEIQKFMASHPHDDGWKRYEYGEDSANRFYLRYLLDFLRDSPPTVMTHRVSLPKICANELLEKEEAFHPAEAGSEWDLRKDLNSTDWYGSVHADWEGHPIHVSSFRLKNTLGYSSLYLVATQSNRALRSFMCALEAYGRARDKGIPREILVVNGDNIPILPVTWDDIVLPAGLPEDIQANVEGFVRGRARYDELGIPYRRGFLFTGPPGTGKTLTLKVLAHTTAAKFITVLGSADVKDSDIKRAFRLASSYTPAVIFLEDLDKLIQANDVSLSYFLNLLDGLNVLDGVLVIATCNEPKILDPALLHRPSRFDRVWRFPLPRYQERLRLLMKRGAKFFSMAALEEAARKSDGFTMAYVQEIVVNALLAFAHNGGVPDDAALLQSLETLRTQRREVTKQQEDVAGHEALGFCTSTG
jgi:SpoVK/Ycf46/Vps4 family AAA+-type ATPase